MMGFLREAVRFGLTCPAGTLLFASSRFIPGGRDLCSASHSPVTMPSLSPSTRDLRPPAEKAVRQRTVIFKDGEKLIERAA